MFVYEVIVVALVFALVAEAFEKALVGHNPLLVLK